MAIKFNNISAERYKDSSVYSFTVEIDGTLVTQVIDPEEAPQPKIFAIQISDSCEDKPGALKGFLKKIEDSYTNPKPIISVKELLNV